MPVQYDRSSLAQSPHSFNDLNLPHPRPLSTPADMSSGAIQDSADASMAPMQTRASTQRKHGQAPPRANQSPVISISDEEADTTERKATDSDEDYIDGRRSTNAKRQAKKQPDSSNIRRYRPTLGREGEDIPVEDATFAKEKPIRIPTDIEDLRQKVVDLRRYQRASQVSQQKSREEIKRRCAEASELRSKIGEQQAQLDELRKQATRFQNDQLKLLTKDEMEGESDDVVQLSLERLFRDLKAWVGHFCITSFDHVDQDRMELIEICLRMLSSGATVTEDFIQAMKSNKVNARAVCNGILNHDLCYATFEQPFAHLRGFYSPVGDRSLATSLEEVIDMASMGKAVSPPSP